MNETDTIDGKNEIQLRDEWMEKAKSVTPDTLMDFINEVMDQPHGYGTVCRAIAAVGVAAMWAANRHPGALGGITGFQSGCVMWDVISSWGSVDGPARLVKYENMLFPQYEYQFVDKTISKEVWDWLQVEAKKNLESRGHASTGVIQHWESIVDGHVPFGYTVDERDLG